MALYRKYRPATFGEVIGQEQVTRPLSTALDNGRISHAYLFSGPRGCGKTSSARILARSLNCAEGPTSTPCGVCESCVALAPGGTGNLDVMELDAASHGGVEDMRELRERALFAPAESRYRVFIIDEAHMITKEGNNALLKIVEEPPAHLIFIFATTEPEKMLGTIRSRTHNYPFRLLAPQAMRELVQHVVEEEGVHVDENVYPLVIRAGGGSPRDTLSILDQMLSGAGEDGLTYELALPLLGVTDLTLLDAAVDALADRDAGAMYRTIDQVIESGHEPRRFALDLLDRMRDLLLIRTVPDAFGQGLVDAPSDRADILTQEAHQFSPQHLAQLASEVNDRIASLRGATSPRLLLEIMAAHLLTLQPAGGAELPQPAASPAPSQSTQPQQAQQPQQPSPARAGGGAAAAAVAAAAAASKGRQQEQQAPAQPEPEQPAPDPRPQPVEQPQEHQAPDTDELFERIDKDWTRLRQSVGERNKVAEIMLTEATPLGFDDDVLVVGHHTGALAERINAEKNNADIATVLSEKLGAKVQVRCVIGTDPATANLRRPAKREVWNPGAETNEGSGGAGDSDSSDGSDSDDPAPAPAGGWDAPAPARQQAPQQTQQQAPQAPAPQPTPSMPAKREDDWRSAALAASQKAAEKAKRERDEIPPPPEPYDYDEGVPEASIGNVPEYSREDEERDMADQARDEAGTADRRDATEVAMDLLAAELGAKPL